MLDKRDILVFLVAYDLGWWVDRMLTSGNGQRV